jgi:hypothetical protein
LGLSIVLSPLRFRAVCSLLFLCQRIMPQYGAFLSLISPVDRRNKRDICFCRCSADTTTPRDGYASVRGESTLSSCLRSNASPKL